MNQPQRRNAKPIGMKFSKQKFVTATVKYALERSFNNAPNDFFYQLQTFTFQAWLTGNTAYCKLCENHTDILTRNQA